MKKIFIFATAVLMMTACGNGNKTESPLADEQTEESTELYDGKEIEKDGLYRIYREPQMVTDENGQLSVCIKMEPAADVATVQNESFQRTYLDNRAMVMLLSEGDTILQKQLQKSSFDEFLDPQFKIKALFNRLVCRKIDSQGALLEAEVSVPHSDEETYILITLSRDGLLKMEREVFNEVPEGFGD